MGIELGLLADPEDPQRQEARQIGQQPRSQLGEQVRGVILGRHALRGRHLQIEDQQRHRDGEDAVGKAASLPRLRPANSLSR